MVDNLLDLLTGGEHRKAKNIIDDHRKFREEEERVRELMDVKNQNNFQAYESRSDLTNSKIEFEQLKTLSEIGIDTCFLNDLELLKDNNVVQVKLENSSSLLEKLQQVQGNRISAAPSPHLSQMLQPSETGLHLADKITESLTDLAKQVPPEAIIPIPAIRKAMGIVPETTLVSSATNTVLPINSSVDGVVSLEGGESSGEEEPCVVGVDFESELREFLESDTALSGFPLHDDKTIEEMLSES